jgi:hypothetical protein
VSGCIVVTGRIYDLRRIIQGLVPTQKNQHIADGEFKIVANVGVVFAVS